MRSSFIALLTDFGTEDGYAGAMKGVLLSLAPHVRVVDISHEIAPFNIRQAAFCLNNSYSHFPEHTVFVTVVDPGVGSERKGIVIRTSQHVFVGPDNGVFSFVIHREGYRAYEIDLTAFAEPISPTFHGRDVFARVAAYIANGQDLGKMVKPLAQVTSFLKSPIKIRKGEYRLAVFHVDHFGNLILNLHRDECQKLEIGTILSLQCGEHTINGIHDTFGNVQEGEFLLTWDSSGFLQVALNKGDASRALNVAAGDTMLLFGR